MTMLMQTVIRCGAAAVVAFASATHGAPQGGAAGDPPGGASQSGSLLEEFLRDQQAKPAPPAATDDHAPVPVANATRALDLQGSARGVCLLDEVTGQPLPLRIVSAPPLALRSGRWMMAVERSDPTAAWPTACAVKLWEEDSGVASGGVDPEAPLVALQELTDRGAASWTDPVRWIVPVAPTNEALAWVLVRIPLNAPRELELLRPANSTSTDAGQFERIRVVDPIAPGDLGVGDVRHSLSADTRDQFAAPQHRAPAEHIRDRLAARGVGAATAPIHGTALDMAFAEAVADRWDAALAMIASVHPVVAEQVVRSLGGVVHGADESGRDILVAGWNADPAQLDRLLAGMEDQVRTHGAVNGEIEAAQFAQRWFGDQAHLGVWTERQSEEGLVVGVLNPSFDHQVAEATWIGSQQTTTMPVPSGSYRTFVIPHATDAMSETLLVKGDDREWRLMAPPDAVPIAPPGIDCGPFVREAALADAMAGTVMLPPAEWATRAIVRRRPNGWEVALEAMRPHDAAGRDEVLIDFPAAATRIHLTESGPIQTTSLLPGGGPASAGAELRVDRASEADRWTAVVTLPMGWMGGEMPKAGMRVPLAISRRIAGLGRFTPVRPLLPWNEQGHEITLDVSSWPMPSLR